MTDVPDIDPDDPAAMATIMHESNEERIAALEEKAGPGQQGSLANAFDALRILTYVEQIAYKLEISDVCALDFEGRRAKMIGDIEVKYEQMLAAKEAAERQQRLAGGPTLVRPPS